MDEIVEPNIYEEELAKDSKAIEAYLKNVYGESAPRPTPPTEQELSFWRIAGLESSLFVLSGLGAAVLSSIRTGGLFWLLEELLFDKFGVMSELGGLFGFVSMISALLAFEGFLLAYGLAEGRKSGKMEVSKTGLAISLTTVISAGIFSSFSIVNVSDNFQIFMNVLLALITGGSSALIAYYSTKNLGYILNHVAASKNKVLSDHQTAYTHWREAGLKAYFKSHYNIRHSKSGKIYSQPQINQQPQQYRQEASQESSKKVSKTQLAYDFVRDFYFKNGDLPTNQRVADSVDISVGSAFNGICKFVVDNEEELLSKGIVTEEKIRESYGNLKISPREKEHGENQISEFIRLNERFPNEDDLNVMGVSLQDAARWVSANEQYIRENNLLPENTIQQAINMGG